MKPRASKYREDGQVANRIKQSFKGSRISDLEDEKGDFMNLKEYQQHLVDAPLCREDLITESELQFYEKKHGAQASVHRKSAKKLVIREQDHLLRQSRSEKYLQNGNIKTEQSPEIAFGQYRLSNAYAKSSSRNKSEDINRQVQSGLSQIDRGGD